MIFGKEFGVLSPGLDGRGSITISLLLFSVVTYYTVYVFLS